jgi:hypothetical protein
MTLIIYLDGPVSLRRISPELNHQLFHKISPGDTVGRLTEVVSGLHGIEGDPLQSAIEPEWLPDAQVPAMLHLLHRSNLFGQGKHLAGGMIKCS